jgi:hypothetical protein
MKAGVEVTFDDLMRMLRSLAHDLADEAEAGYRLRARRSGGSRSADGLKVATVLERGESHDGTGR